MSARRYAVDPDRCRRCGLEPDGLRCSQPITLGYERALARARASQRWEGRAPLASCAPCTRACPLSLCVQGYAKHVAAGELAEALGHVVSRTALPETVCRVCDRPCEAACARATLEGPVAINDLKRYIVAHAHNQPPRVAAETGKRVAIVGAGPSGLSAARELALAGHEVTLLDAEERAGGVPALHIPRYRLPAEAIERDVEGVLALGVRFAGGTRLGRDVTLEELLARYDAVYLATGAGKARSIHLPGEGPRVVQALDLLREARDGAARIDGAVVVVGGGDAAVDAARSALRAGARSAAIACLEDRDAMPALPEEVAAASEEGIAIHGGLAPLHLGPRALVLAPTTGRAAPNVRLEADLVVLAIGQVPDASFLERGAPPLARDAEGRLSVDPATGRTSHPRVFAGGDLVGAGTVTRAMAAGLRAAAAIHRTICDAPPLRPPALEERPRPGPLPLRAVPAARRRAPQLAPAERARSFDEVGGVLSHEDARAEAERCLVCGSCANCRVCIDGFGCPALVLEGAHVTVDPALCNGCGVCVDLCPNGAFVLVEGP